MPTGGDFALVQDIARITVVVDTLDQLADVVEALQQSRHFVVVRNKNRWDPAHRMLATGGEPRTCAAGIMACTAFNMLTCWARSTQDVRPECRPPHLLRCCHAPTGYRDFQILARMQIDGRWTSIEIQVRYVFPLFVLSMSPCCALPSMPPSSVLRPAASPMLLTATESSTPLGQTRGSSMHQVNLRSFVELKDDKRRGHGAFDLARIIQAFNEETVVFTGAPTAALWGNVAAGMFLELDLSGSELTTDNFGGAGFAVRNENCRLDAISLSACGAALQSLEKTPHFLGDSIAQIVAGTASLRQLDLGGLRGLTADGFVAVLASVDAHAGIAPSRFTPPEDPATDRLLELRFGIKSGVSWDMSRKGYTDADCADVAAAILASTRVEVVNLADNSIGGTGAAVLVAAIAKSKTATELNLSRNSIGDTGAATVAAGIVTSNPTTDLMLNLSDNNIGDSGAGALAAVIAKSTILAVNLSNNVVGDAGANALATAIAQSKTDMGVNLTRNSAVSAAGWVALAVSDAVFSGSFGFKLGDTKWDLRSKDLTDDDCVWLVAAVAQSKAVKEVRLAHNKIGAPGWALLAGSEPILAGMLAEHGVKLGDTTWNLECKYIYDADCGWLGVAISMATELKELKMYGNYVGGAGAEALAEGLANCGTLEKVDLRTSKIGDAGAQALAAAFRNCPKLETVLLSKNKIGEAGAQALAAAFRICLNPRTIDMAHNAIGDVGAAALFHGLVNCPNLESLDLSDNAIGDAAAAALGRGLANCPNLESLDLSNNSIGDDTAEALVAALPNWPKVEKVGLTRNSIGNVGARALAAALPNCAAFKKRVDFSCNSFGAAGALALAAVLPSCPRVTGLTMTSNSIGDAGAQAFAAVLPNCPNLRYLSLERNSISDAGAQTLATVLPSCQSPELVMVNLSGNSIGAAGKAALEKAERPGLKIYAGQQDGDQDRDGRVWSSGMLAPDDDPTGYWEQIRLRDYNRGWGNTRTTAR